MIIREQMLTIQLGQFPPPKSDDALQPTAVQDRLYSDFLLHLKLCLPLVKILS